MEYLIEEKGWMKKEQKQRELNTKRIEKVKDTAKTCLIYLTFVGGLSRPKKRITTENC